MSRMVNAKYDKQEGNLAETPEKTNVWAWKHPHEDGTTTYERVRGDVRFFDVDFGYNPDKIVLHDVSLYAEPGQKVAFVGATGAGKTTITNLINRFYDLADGKIRYDGININKIKKADLRRSLGIVAAGHQPVHRHDPRQHPLRQPRERPIEEVEAAAQLANADDFIRRLPDGYDTVIDGEGGSLSQGQRQLISIARAAVADPARHDPRRGDKLDRHPHRVHRAGGHGRPDVRPHGVCHRPPPVHRAELGTSSWCSSLATSSSAARTSS